MAQQPIRVENADKIIQRLNKLIVELKSGTLASYQEKEINETITLATEKWQAEVKATYRSRSGAGLSTSGQLANSLVATHRGWNIVFKMKPIFHTYHSAEQGGMVTTEYGKFIRGGFGASQKGKYDPCVDTKLYINVRDPKTGQYGMHPGVSKYKYWVPMKRRWQAEVKIIALREFKAATRRILTGGLKRRW